MKQYGLLVYYECKKICKRKSTWFTLGILLAFYLVMECAYLFGSTYINGEFLETHIEGTRIDLEHGRRLSGKKIDDTLLGEMQGAYAQIQDDFQDKIQDKNDRSYMLTKEYQKTVRPYTMLYNTIRYMLYNTDYNPLTVTEEQLYEGRREAVKQNWDDHRLTDAEKAYWQKKEDRLAIPFTYEYAEGWENLISMSGVYRVCLLITFLIAICMSSVFTEEHGRRMDQMILCSRLGKRQTYFAKITAGSIVCLSASAVILLCAVTVSFFMYGTDGYTAAAQQAFAEISESLTVGQIMWIMTGILLLSSVLTGIFTMVLSEIVNSNIASMAVVTASLFLARLIPIPYQYRVFSQAWNYIPINLLKLDEGFADCRLVSLFGLKLASWQSAPILYVILGLLFIIIGQKVYGRCRT